MKTENRLLPIILFLFLTCSVVPAYSLQASTPQDALEEIATAENIATVMKHLPLKVQEYMQKLPVQEKAAMADKLLLSKNLEREGGKLSRTDDGNGWELVEKDGKSKGTITFKKTFISGTDALVELEVKEGEHSETAMIGMRFEGDEWRVMKVGHWQGTDLEAEFLHKAEAQEQASDTAAASNLRTLNTALLTYSTAYPEVGYPAALPALSGLENQEGSAEHAKLVDGAFLAVPAAKYGYEFRYTLIDPGNVPGREGRYLITATPLELGKAGARSFFTDQTAIVRFTAEPRPANENDPPL
jgi:hypothetical protein